MAQKTKKKQENQDLPKKDTPPFPKNFKTNNISPQSNTNSLSLKNNSWYSSPILIGAVIFVTLIGAVAIPFFISINKVVKLQPLDRKKPIFEFKEKENTVITLNLEQLEKKSQSLDSVYVSSLEKLLFSEMIKYLYEKEQRASKRFSAIYNKLLELQNRKDSVLHELPTINTFYETNKVKLEDVKLNFQRSFGIKNWPDAFGQELLKPQYGNSSSEEEALDFMVISNIKKYAFAPWKLSVNSQFSRTLKEGMKVLEDVTFVEEGEVKTAFKAGDVASFDFLKHSKSTSPYTKNQNSDSVSGFLAETFVPEYKDVFEKLLDFLMIKRFKIFWSVPLPIEIERGDQNVTFKVTKEDLKKLLQLFPIAFKDTPGEEVTFQTKTLLDILIELPGVRAKKSNFIFNNQIDKAKLQEEILNSLEEGDDSEEDTQEQDQSNDSSSEESISEDLNTSSINIQTLSEIVSDSPDISPAFLDSVFVKRQLSASSWNNLTTLFLKEFLPASEFEHIFGFLSRKKINEINEQIAVAIENYPLLENLIDKVFKSVFVQPFSKNSELATVFKILEKNLVFSKDQVYLLNILNINEYSQYLEDFLQEHADEGKSDEMLKKVFELFEDEDTIFYSMLSSPEFLEHIFSKKNPLKDNSNYDSEDLNKVLTVLRKRLSSSKEAIMLDIFDALSTFFQDSNFINSSLDFIYQGDKLFFRAKSPEDESILKPVLEVINKTFDEEFGV